MTSLKLLGAQMQILRMEPAHGKQSKSCYNLIQNQTSLEGRLIPYPFLITQT